MTQDRIKTWHCLKGGEKKKKCELIKPLALVTGVGIRHLAVPDLPPPEWPCRASPKVWAWCPLLAGASDGCLEKGWWAQCKSSPACSSSGSLKSRVRISLHRGCPQTGSWCGNPCANSHPGQLQAATPSASWELPRGFWLSTSAGWIRMRDGIWG